MSRFIKITMIAVVSVLALGLAFAAGTVVRTGVASAAVAAENVFRSGRGGSGGPSFPAGPNGEDLDQYLADALGVSLADLQAAYTTAQEAALAQAVNQGLLTQEQADAIQERLGSKGFGFGHGFGGRGLDRGVDFDALLADALNISVDELQTARTKAHHARIDAAVASGELTQEQADQMQAMQALRGYIDREFLSAQALGLAVDELQAARQAGKSMADLLTEKGLTQAEYEEAYQAAYEAAVAKAVTDGIITQEQADEILSKTGLLGGPGNFGRGGPGGGGPGGPGGPRGDCPPSEAPATTPAPNDGTPGSET